MKDGLRAWLERKAKRVGAEDEKSQCGTEEGKISVRKLVQRFTASRKSIVGDGRWGGKRKVADEREKREPPRAHVYGLRKFWEGLARSQEVRS